MKIYQYEKWTPDFGGSSVNSKVSLIARGKRRISYSRDFYGTPRISMGFPGFPSDFKGLAIPGIRRFPLV